MTPDTVVLMLFAFFLAAGFFAAAVLWKAIY